MRGKAEWTGAADNRKEPGVEQKERSCVGARAVSGGSGETPGRRTVGYCYGGGRKASLAKDSFLPQGELSGLWRTAQTRTRVVLVMTHAN